MIDMLKITTKIFDAAHSSNPRSVLEIPEGVTGIMEYRVGSAKGKLLEVAQFFNGERHGFRFILREIRLKGSNEILNATQFWHFGKMITVNRVPKVLLQSGVLSPVPTLELIDQMCAIIIDMPKEHLLSASVQELVRKKMLEANKKLGECTDEYTDSDL